MARATERKKRTPIDDNHRSRLAVRGKDPAYEYYIVNDTPGRIDQYKEAGWEPVTDENTTIGDTRVANTTDVSSVKTVSVGQGITGVLMKIPKEYWDEDREMKNQRATEQVSDFLEKKRQYSDYGKIDIQRN